MTKFLLMTTIVLLVGLVGCNKSDFEQANTSPGSEPVYQQYFKPAVSESQELDLSKTTKAEAEKHFENRQFTLWSDIADTKIRLVGQQARKLRLAQLLALAKVDKEKFFRVIEAEGSHPGISINLQLQMFDRVRERIQKELDFSDRIVTRLDQTLQRMIAMSDKPMEDLNMNQNRPVSEFDFTEAQLQSLEDLRIRTARDFTLQFYLPQQHDLLASLLKIDVGEARILVEQIAQELPADELKLLANQTLEPRSFGALPPTANKDN